MCIRDALDAIRQIDRPVREPENYAVSISRDAVLAAIILHDSQWNLKRGFNSFWTEIHG